MSDKRKDNDELIPDEEEVMPTSVDDLDEDEWNEADDEEYVPDSGFTSDSYNGIPYAELSEQMQGLAEKHRYEEFEQKFGVRLAIFFCCIQYDKPFEINCIPQKANSTMWRTYKFRLRKHNLLKKENGHRRRFLDGETDIMKVFDEPNRTVMLWGKKADEAFLKRPKRFGTAEQREMWGTGSDKRPYSNEDFDELDRIYAAFSARSKSAGGLDPQQEYILKSCAQMELERKKCIADGEFSEAQKLNKMIQDNLASENLRKKDEKPLDDLRLDGIADALEKKFGLEKGKLLTKEEVLEVCCKWFMSHRYPYTLDAAHQMTLAIINATRMNNDEPQITELPSDLAFEDTLGEFAEQPNQAEKDAYDYLGLVRGSASDSDEEDDDG